MLGEVETDRFSRGHLYQPESLTLCLKAREDLIGAVM